MFPRFAHLTSRLFDQRPDCCQLLPASSGRSFFTPSVCLRFPVSPFLPFPVEGALSRAERRFSDEDRRFFINGQIGRAAHVTGWAAGPDPDACAS